MSLHPIVEPLSFLIGDWSGQGFGHYPTIEDFSYSETITFAAAPGKPFLRYSQQTVSPKGMPMHVETGYLRPVDGGTCEFVIAQPTGQTELLHGTYTEDAHGAQLLFDESCVVNSHTAKQVGATQRRYVFNAERTELIQEFEMQAVGQPMGNHLRSTLTKQ